MHIYSYREEASLTQFCMYKTLMTINYWCIGALNYDSDVTLLLSLSNFCFTSVPFSF